jgi:hypothetical protein
MSKRSKYWIETLALLWVIMAACAVAGGLLSLIGLLCYLTWWGLIVPAMIITLFAIGYLEHNDV